jgi:hypothetical protein
MKTVFISCGQYTEEEKQLGIRISEMVKLAGFDPFFAQEVHDLNSLDENILQALKNCVGFVTVLHPRGEIKTPDGPILTRASVWIEQELAIATYIKRVEKRPIEIIAFKHKLVSLEGIRQLIHLNPIEFAHEPEVLEILPARLRKWNLKPTGVNIQIQSVRNGKQEDHFISTINIQVVNDTNNRIEQYVGKLSMPDAFLKHWNETYFDSSVDAEGNRSFKFDQTGRGPIDPHDSKKLQERRYCTQCASSAFENIPGWVASAKITAKIWINGQEYSTEKTIRELSEGA